MTHSTSVRMSGAASACLATRRVTGSAFSPRHLFEFEQIRCLVIPIRLRTNIDFEAHGGLDVIVHQPRRHPHLFSIMRLGKWAPAISTTQNRPSRGKREFGRIGFSIQPFKPIVGHNKDRVAVRAGDLAALGTQTSPDALNVSGNREANEPAKTTPDSLVRS